MTDIEVTQADRDAVRSWASFTTDMTMSTDDYADLVRAFARHRLEGQSKLVEALRPFVDAADFYDSCDQHPNGCPDNYPAGELVGLTVGDFRRARTALHHKGSGE